MTDTRARAQSLAEQYVDEFLMPEGTDAIERALADERRRTLEEAALAMCDDCQKGMPLELEFDGELGFWHSDNIEGTWRCKGSAIRAKAQAGPEEEKKS